MKLDETAKTGWIIDGSYVSKIGNVVKDSATDIICESTDSLRDILTCLLGLDPPFILYFPRVCYRSFSRLVGYGQPCSQGCGETWSDVFSLGEKSILWWSWTHHDPCRRRQQAEMMSEGFRDKTRRLGGWGGELENWIKDVQETIRNI